MHSKVEGTYEYTLLLFIPSQAPFDLWVPEPGRGVKLHVRRVFIMEDTGQLMPMYLRFVRGVIDSSDLPLNVSRELLQSSRVVDSIRSSAVKKVLRLLEDLAENEPGQVRHVLEGVRRRAQGGRGRGLRQPRRDRQAAALHLDHGRHGEAEDVSLADYVGRMKEGQDKIYYMLAPTLAAAASSPHLEVFRKKGIEVLLLATAWTTGWSPACPSSTASRCSRSPRATPTSARWRTRPSSRPRSRPAPTTPALVAQLKAILDGRPRTCG